MKKDTAKNTKVFGLLRTTILSITNHPIILYPLCIAIFIQLLILEILYFAPRFPLSTFFGPLIRLKWGELSMHYPYTFKPLTDMFYYTQIPIYVFVGSFLYAMTVALIAAINNEQKTSFRSAFRETLPQYLHIIIAAGLSTGLFFFLTRLYEKVIDWIMILKSTGNVVLFVKKVLFYSTPYVNLLLGVFATVLFVFVIPIIVIERKKIISAVILNFRTLFRSYWFMLAVVLVPTLFYVPLLLLRSNMAVIASSTIPGIQLLVIILSIVVSLFIDVTVFAATTMYYLLKREHT